MKRENYQTKPAKMPFHYAPFLPALVSIFKRQWKVILHESVWQSSEKPLQGETLQEIFTAQLLGCNTALCSCSLRLCELRQLLGAQLNNKGNKFNLHCSPPTVKILNLWVKLRNLKQQNMAQNGQHHLWFLSCNSKVYLRSFLLFALTQFIFFQHSCTSCLVN